MKKLLLACASLLAAVAAYGQGQVVFANTSTSLFTTNNGATPPVTGPISGANRYRIGLYTAPAGTTTESLFTLIAVATNSPLAAGRFSYPDSPYTIAGNNGTPIAYQVRAWALAAGNSYETAAGAFRGQTLIGTITPAVGGAPAPNLFSDTAGVPNFPGQLSTGAVLTAIPEPSSIALGLLGLGAIALFRRRK